METWATIESGITTVLTSASLTRLPENQEIEQAASVHEDNYYSLKPIGIENQNLTSGGGLGSYKIQLDIVYINNTSSERATNFDTTVSVMNSLLGLGRFNGFDGEATFTDLNNKQSKATIVFYYGVRDC